MLLYVLLTQQYTVHSTATFFTFSFYSKVWLLNKLKKWRAYHNYATNGIKQRHHTINIFLHVTFNMYSFRTYYTTHSKHLCENSEVLFRWPNCVKLKMKFHNGYDNENTKQKSVPIILHTVKALRWGVEKINWSITFLESASKECNLSLLKNRKAKQRTFRNCIHKYLTKQIWINTVIKYHNAN